MSAVLVRASLYSGGFCGVVFCGQSFLDIEADSFYAAARRLRVVEGTKLKCVMDV